VTEDEAAAGRATGVDGASARPTASLRGRRVVFVLPWAELAGAERQALSCARHLRAVEGADVEVCALTSDRGTAIAAYGEQGIPWTAVPVEWYGSRRRKARELLRLARGLRRSRPDVVLPFCTPANVLCGLVWRTTGAATCIWHQQDVLSSRYGDGLVRKALRTYPLIISNSAHALTLVEGLGGERDRMRVVPPLVDVPEPVSSRAAWRAQLELGADELLVCMLGTLGPKKDHATLLRAWSVVVHSTKARGRGVTLVLAGRSTRGGEEAAKALAYDLELAHTVRFLGHVEDIGGLLASVDVAVLSSRSEGLPNAVLEPMAVGLPIVATDIPGVREAVGSDAVALLVPTGDPEALADALVRALADDRLRTEARNRNPASIAGRFGPERTVAVHAAVVAEALARGRRARLGGSGARGS
jgi:glycosyltransferase involved in cell wall biosynthesis